ncbi:MAG: hypothetical protein CVV27_08975 [Candidatus Melainabacteria bacterium HGW-Melainabacteria-1]|nr:MAG: hypothetical protein CVV27_08975 [Candidatus Melainabacteria bacterium HGW-Melainabacteria-1]
MPYKFLIHLSLAASLTLLSSSCTELFNQIGQLEPDTQSQNPDTGNATTAVKQIRPATGTVQEDLIDVSGEFEVQFSSEQSEERTLRFPLTAKYLPENLDLSDFQLERFDEPSGQWIAEGILSGWDPAQNQIAFEVKNPIAGDFSTSLIKLFKYRIRVYIFSNAVTVRNPDSNFRITYYPISYGYKASVKRDTDWRGSGLNEEPDIPNYIEDLDQALNEAYKGLLEIKDSAGAPLFKALKTPIDVNVLDTGTDLGNSPLGGPANFSAKAINNWQDMRQTAAHELTHVFQGQYYSIKGLFTGRANKWFIEASAQYFAARAMQLNPTERAEHYSDGAKNIENYLSVPVLASDARSYYALGHFFDWASAETSEGLIPDVLSKSSVRDSRALNSQLQQQAGFSSLGDAINQYGRFIVTHPQTDAGLGQNIKNAMRSYARKFLDKPVTNLINQNIYIPFKRELPALASNYLSVIATELTGDNLLVIAAKDKDHNIETLSYSNPAASATEYQNMQALDRNTSLFSEESLTLPHFGKGQPNKGFEIWLSNTSLTESATADFEIYALCPPKVLEVKAGSVRWDQTALADLPHEKIKGYSVYIGGTALKRNLPIETGKTEQVFTHASILANSEVKVTLTDVLGHEWPAPVKEDVEIKLKNIAFNNFGGSSNPDLPKIITRNPGNSISFETEVTGTANQTLQWQLAATGTGGVSSLARATPVMDADMSQFGSITQSGNQVTIQLQPSLKGIHFIWAVGTSLADPAVRTMFVIEIWGL